MSRQPQLTPVEESSYLTLGGRVLDSQAAHPFLGCPLSATIASHTGYDVEAFPMPRSKFFDIAVRAKKLDEIVTSFIARHSDAVVVDLGAGFDPRIERVDPPSTVDWFDVDLPGITQIRQETIPARPNLHTLTADIAELSWLQQLPRDRPVVVVADGLVAFLSDSDFAMVLDQLSQTCSRGWVAFNGYTRFHMWVIQRYGGTESIADTVRHSGFDDPREPEKWAPGLTLADEILLTRAREVRELPLAQRALMRLAGLSTYLSRRWTTVLRYQF